MRRLLPALLLLAGPLRAGENAMPTKSPAALELKEGFFRAEVPAWEKSRDEDEDRRTKVFGVLLTAPAQGEEPRMSLTVEYYAPGNAYFEDADAYLARQTAPAEIELKSKRVSKPRPAKLGKLKARTWSREAAQPFPPDSQLAKTYEMRTETVLAEAKQGFYVLSYTAPKSRFLKNRKAFQRALDTFAVLAP